MMVISSVKIIKGRRLIVSCLASERLTNEVLEVVSSEDGRERPDPKSKLDREEKLGWPTDSRGDDGGAEGFTEQGSQTSEGLRLGEN